jgi:ribokinase
MAKIVVVGSFNADLVTDLLRLPQAGETVFGERFGIVAGGKGSNQAVAMARLGAQVTFVGCIGRDALAEIGVSLWAKEGIETAFVARSDSATGVAVIFVEAGGANVIVVTKGANDDLSHAHIDAARSVIAEADFVIAPLETPLDTVRYAFQTAHELGVKTILNPAPAMPLDAELLALVDYLTPNEHELAILAQGGDTVTAARSLLTQAEQTVIVTLGAQGAQWITASATGRIPAYAVEVVDTVGAGDAFNGGLAVALAEGKSLEQALGFASAVAGLSVTRRGAADSMPQRAEVDAFIQTRSH